MATIVENSIQEQELLQKLNQLITAKTCSLEEIRNILAKIPSKSRPTWNHESPLVWAVLSNNKVLVRLLIEEQKFNVNSKSLASTGGSYDWCALGSAIKTKNEEMAKFLVFEMKADVNIKKTPADNILTAAIFEGNFWAVTFMVKELNASLEYSLKMVTDPSITYTHYPIHWAMWQDYQR